MREHHPKAGVVAARDLLADARGVVLLGSTYDAADLPTDAVVSGASAYVSKERFIQGLQSALDAEPIVLPAWDPMGALAR
jgi:hypothetical protein